MYYYEYILLFYFYSLGAVYRSRKKMVSNYKVLLRAILNLFGFSSFFRQFCLFFFVEINAIYF